MSLRTPWLARGWSARVQQRLQTALLGGRMAVVALLVWLLLFQVSVVRGSSMTPGIVDGDRILIEPWSYWMGAVRRGDVVVLRYPVDPSVDYIKRVVGLPGDLVAMAGGRVWVNGTLLDEPYAISDPLTWQVEHVRDGHYFVLGDNRPRSADSREFGQVAAELLRGRVDLRVWPPRRAGILE
jgi:signal peptidase I